MTLYWNRKTSPKQKDVCLHSFCFLKKENNQIQHKSAEINFYENISRNNKKKLFKWEKVRNGWYETHKK